MRYQRGTALLAAALVVLSFACSPAPSSSVVGRVPGASLRVVGSWSDVEQQRFEKVLRVFESRTGAKVRYVSAKGRLVETLAAGIRDGRLPDVAFLPQPGLLREYAAAHRLVPLDEATAQLVAANYARVWQTLSTYDGREYGVWFKAANKSLVWYDVGAFERAGVAPPTDVTGLLRVSRMLAAAGVPAFAVAGADAWTLTDWFENLYLRVAGPPRYELLASHRLAWTDESVLRTLRLMREVLAPAFLAGGVRGSLRTTFAASVRMAFGVPSRAAMVAEGDFVAGAVTGSTHAELGVDVDVFPFPAVDGSPPAVVGGGDVAVLLHDSPAGRFLLRYLATPEAAAIWAAAGGFISPNVNLDLAAYPDPLTRDIARNLLEAGDTFRFDLSDLTPVAFGGTDTSPLWRELQSFLVTGDDARTATRLEAAARLAWQGVEG